MFARLHGCALLWLALSAQPAIAQLSAELADLAARIEYGFYADEQPVIEAARAALGRSSEGEPLAGYYDALAAFRLAQLEARAGADPGKLIGECSAHEPAGDERSAAAAEAWALVAACASLAVHTEPMRSLLHQRRRDQALMRAREIDPANPRIALVEAWRVSHRAAVDPAPVSDDAAQKLAEAVRAFRSWAGSYDAPQWGEAEALAQLGEIYLEQGNARQARDLIEQALLLAPDYRFALDLQSRLHRSP